MTAITKQTSGRLEAAYLGAQLAEWGVFSFSRIRARHEISKFRTQETALQARELIRKHIDAWALLMHYDPAAGRWRPVTGVEVAR